jgi:hypothetical protein
MNMNVDAALRLIPGWIGLVLVLAVTAARGESGLPGEPPLDGAPGPRGYVLICNTTTETIRYRSWYPGTPEKSMLQTLAPDGSHLYAVSLDFICRHGTSGAVVDSLLHRGTIYEFRAATGKPGGPVTLVAVSRTEQGAPTPGVPALPPGAVIPIPRQPAAAPAPAVATVRERERERELEVTIERLEAEVERLRSRPAESRPPVAKAVAPRGTGLHWSGATVSLGPLDLSAGAAEAALTLTLARDPDTAPTTLTLAADFTLARGTVRVRPAATEMPADGVLKLMLAFDGIPAAATRAGKLIVRAANAPQDPGLVIPLSVTFRAPLAVLGTDRDTASILSWPPDADVYVVAESRVGPWSLEHLGTTPVVCRLPAGRYQALLVRRGATGGQWLVPGSQSLGPDAGADTKRAARVWVDFEKRQDAPTLVRALWVDGTGSAAEQLDRATSACPTLFKLPPFDEFHVPLAEMVARAGIALDDQDARVLYRALRRCGWLRYELVRGVAIDVEYDPKAAVGHPFRLRPVPLLPEFPGNGTQEATP